MLYLVPTPIGNLEDMTPRAIRVLMESQLILAEDTRTSGNLLKHFDIKTPLRAYHSFNEHNIVSEVVSQLQAGQDISLITDAGTPGISDPGYLLVREAIQAGVQISALPGATSFVPALVASGLPTQHFYYEGFLPHKKGRQTRLKFLAELVDTFVLFESPHRLVKCLEQLAEYCGPDRKACVAREISKMFEEFTTDSLQNLIDKYKQKEKVKGEIVIVVGGKNN
jgi:16S rRNA (cytidine1402-2'-O)-methyltransferase